MSDWREGGSYTTPAVDGWFVLTGNFDNYFQIQQ
jgi:hypothetical protein